MTNGVLLGSYGGRKTDFNGDGKSDLLWQNSDGTPSIWEMSGTGVIATATAADPGSAWHLIPLV